MAGLYLFCIDDRESAHCYVSSYFAQARKFTLNQAWLTLLPSLQLSNAIRIAQMEGLHTQLPEEELGAEKVTYCQDLWWTLYIMDRHFSSSLGLPMSVQDSDITTPVNPPNIGSQSDSARSLQVNLSHLMSIIVTSKSYHSPFLISLTNTLG